MTEEAYWKKVKSTAFGGFDKCGKPIFRDLFIFQCSDCGKMTPVPKKQCSSCGKEMRKEICK